jgi:hypothetical protein
LSGVWFWAAAILFSEKSPEMPKPVTSILPVKTANGLLPAISRKLKLKNKQVHQIRIKNEAARPGE